MADENISRIKKVKKRDGRVVEFCIEKITHAIMKAAEAVGGHDALEAKQLSTKITTILEYEYDMNEVPTIEEVVLQGWKLREILVRPAKVKVKK